MRTNRKKPGDLIVVSGNKTLCCNLKTFVDYKNPNMVASMKMTV